MPGTKEKPKLLVHICCIGCGAHAARELAGEYEAGLYFYNPNIYPEAEYLKRLEETVRAARESGLPLVRGAYDHRAWRKMVKGREHDPERGRRCLLCYEDRLQAAAGKAKELGCAAFTTTLTVSPHKDAAAILNIGRRLAAEYGIGFLDRDFKKQDGFKKACELSKELNLYRQGYCGCEYSINPKTQITNPK
jgi:predicted adenine nucleotide alpha hydrolase (AANH) superfamily ATPase